MIHCLHSHSHSMTPDRILEDWGPELGFKDFGYCAWPSKQPAHHFSSLSTTQPRTVIKSRPLVIHTLVCNLFNSPHPLLHTDVYQVRVSQEQKGSNLCCLGLRGRSKKQTNLCEALRTTGQGAASFARGSQKRFTLF